MVKSFEKVVRRNQVTSEISLMSMNENLVADNFNYKADYKECIEFLNSIEKMKSYMQKGIKIRIKALESIVDDKYAKVIAKESKHFMIKNRKIEQLFKKITVMASGFYNMIYLFMGIYMLNVTQKIIEGKKH
jgi:hypothetical protein